MIIEKLPTRRYFITVFVIVLSLFVAFSLVIYKNFSDAQRLNQWTIYTYETARLSRKLLFDLVDMETGVRGYLITGNKKFLVPYDQSLRSINVQVKYLWEYTKSDPTMQDNIDNWLREIEKFNNLLDSQIRDISHGGKRGISPAVMEQQRKQMDRLRRSLETYIQQRLSLLNSQLKAADQSHQNFKYVLLIGATLAIGSTLLATVIILTLLSRSKRAEEESREIEQRFVAIMSGINDGVFDLNLVNDEIYYSSSYKSMLGYTDEEFPNVPNATWDMIHPEDLSQVREVFRAYLAGEQELYTNIYRMLHKQGQWIWVMSRGIGIRDKSGKIVRLIGTHTDITEQKKREEELASLNNEMEAFTYITSHDLRSPLVNLKGFAKEMDHAVTRVLPVLEAHMEQFSVEEQKVLHESIQVDIQESLRFIEQSVAKMDALTTAVLDLSRIGKREYRVEPVDLNAIVRRCLDTLAYEINRKNVTVTCADLPGIKSDSLALEQVLSNIIDNAVKYLDPSRPGRIDIQVRGYGHEIILSIADNGRGVAQDDKEKVFQIFRRARNASDVRGMGMGMAYVQATVRKLNGAIWFTSVIGEGTTFFLRLPQQLLIKKGSGV